MSPLLGPESEITPGELKKFVRDKENIAYGTTKHKLIAQENGLVEPIEDAGLMQLNPTTRNLEFFGNSHDYGNDSGPDSPPRKKTMSKAQEITGQNTRAL